MIEIYQSTSEQYGISTFNDTINDMFNSEGIPSIINTTKESIDDDGIYIYSSRDQFKKLSNGEHIFVVHGIHNDNFLPPLGVIFNQIWCFSDRVEKYLNKNGYKNVRQKPQVVDDIFWNAKPKSLGNVLIIDPRNGGFYANEVHRSVCKYANLGVRWISEMMSPEDLRDEIINASIVIAKGRSAIESILCRTPTIIYGHESGDGLVNQHNLEEMMITNMSGWSSKISVSISEEIEKAREMKPSELNRIRISMKNVVGSSMITSETFLQW